MESFSKICLLFAVIELSESTTYTFFGRSTSAIQYYPKWITTGTTHQISITFRTFEADTVLFEQSLMYANISVDYYTTVYLENGNLKVTHAYKDYMENFLFAQGLHDNQWHTIELMKNVRSGSITMITDGEHSAAKPLLAYTTGDAGSVLDHETYRVVIGEISKLFLGTHKNYRHFVGCIKDINIYQDNAQLMDLTSLVTDVSNRSCYDACSQGNLCKNGGKCVNLYTSTICQCRGTGYDGDICEEPPVVISLHITGWISYDTVATYGLSNVWSIEFKTDRASCALFYQGGNNASMDFISAALLDGRVHYNMSLDGLVIHGVFPQSVNDSLWHTLTIYHHSGTINVTLDTSLQTQTTTQRLIRLNGPFHVGRFDGLEEKPGVHGKHNFVGCLRRVYHNLVSVLEHLKSGNSSSSYHGPTPLNYTCQNGVPIPVSFTSHLGSYLELSVAASCNLSFSFWFTSFQEQSLIVSGDVKVNNNISAHYELRRHGGQVEAIVYGTKITVGNGDSDRKWHHIEFSAVNRVIHLSLDGQYNNSATIQHDLRFGGSLVIGRIKYGFIGCIQDLRLQRQSIDMLEAVLVTKQASGLIFDNCSPRECTCENGGKCTSTWKDSSCDCRGTAFEGLRCERAKYKTSCHDYYAAGDKISGHRVIDVLGLGTLLKVYCDMSSDMGRRVQGATIVYHNLRPNTLMRSKKRKYVAVAVNYGHEPGTLRLLEQMIRQSSACRQYIEFKCTETPLNLGRSTLMRSGNTTLLQIGHGQAGHCPCAADRGCVRLDVSCNCDVGLSSTQFDYGYITNSSFLPITAMEFFKTGEGSTHVTLGPVVCMSNADWKDALDFGDVDSNYIELPTWKSREFEFSFSTNQSDGLLMTQKYNDSSMFFQLELLSGYIWMFYNMFTVRKPHLEPIPSPALNDGRWHIVTIRIHDNSVTVSVDGSTTSRLINMSSPHFKWFDGKLVMGIDSRSVGPGFSGRLLGVRLNNRYVEMANYTKDGVKLVSGFENNFFSSQTTKQEFNRSLFLGYKLEISEIVHDDEADEKTPPSPIDFDIMLIVIPMVIVAVMLTVCVIVAICLKMKRQRVEKKTVARRSDQVKTTDKWPVAPHHVVYSNPIHDSRQDVISNLPLIDADSQPKLGERIVDQATLRQAAESRTTSLASYRSNFLQTRVTSVGPHVYEEEDLVQSDSFVGETDLDMS